MPEVAPSPGLEAERCCGVDGTQPYKVIRTKGHDFTIFCISESCPFPTERTPVFQCSGDQSAGSNFVCTYFDVQKSLGSCSASFLLALPYFFHRKLFPIARRTPAHLHDPSARVFLARDMLEPVCCGGVLGVRGLLSTYIYIYTYIYIHIYIYIYIARHSVAVG